MNIPRLVRTVRYLKPCQVWFQFWRRVQRTLEPHPKCGSRPLGEFAFLNLTANPKGWNDTSLDMLWRYNLHYFDYLATKDARSAETWIAKWISENPVGSIPGWDPYPTSLRIVNWVKWLDANPDSKQTTDIKSSLAIQLDYLAKHIEWHILANHLLANLKALAIGSKYLGRDNSRWLHLYHRQIGEQVLPDGGHYERSVMYHAIILEDVLDVIKFCGEDAAWLRPIATKMLRYLVNMTGPDRKIAMFNDAADGIAKSTDRICDYAKQLGFAIPAEEQFIDFPDTGYTRMTVGDFVLFVDTAPIGPDYQPGHAHADTLTYELYYKGRKVVTDSGTSEYRGKRRAFERSTAAHNVVEVGGRNSSEAWSSHRVGARARVTVREVSQNRVFAEHNGYGLPVAREFLLSPDGLKVRDALSSMPDCPSGTTRIHLAKDAERLVSVSCQGSMRESFEYALEFGKLEKGTVLSTAFSDNVEYMIYRAK